MNEKKDVERFDDEIFAQMEKIKNFLEVDEFHLGYHFHIQIQPEWSEIFGICQQRAHALGYSSELKDKTWIPKYARVKINGTKINHLSSGGIQTSIEKLPFVDVCGKKYAEILRIESIDDLITTINFGLALEKEIPGPNRPLDNMAANIFRTAEKDLALFFHSSGGVGNLGVFSIGRSKDGLINDRLDLSGSICLNSLIQRVYLAAIGRDPLTCTTKNDKGDQYFVDLPDIAPGFKIYSEGRLTEDLVFIPNAIRDSWLSFQSEYVTIGVKIHPITI
jgi:hypothetical protein